MNVYIKIKEIPEAIYLENVMLIKVLNSRTGKENDIIDFKDFRFYANLSYNFIGKQIFSVWGQNIEYVLFG